MAPGSSRKLCPSCKTSIGVASKKCKFCGAIIKLKVKLEAQKMKATDEWATKTIKYGRFATLINAANKLVHRFHKLGVYPLLLLSKRKKGNILSSTALCPHSGMMNQTSMAAIQRLYEATVKVAINTHTPTLQPSNPPPVAAQELSDTVAPQETSYTLILNQVEPLISPTTQETNSNSLSMTQSNPSNPIQPHPTPSYPIQPHPTPSNRVLPHPTPHNPILPHPTVSYPIQPHPTPSYPIQPHPTPSNPILPHPTVSYPILPHPTPSYPILPHPTVSYPILPHTTPSYLIQPYPTPSYLIQPCPTPSNPILPHPTPTKEEEI
ncbi:uncharacterized protein [Salvelinus alpinus]|uniref:uncharacterized protein n=1 Tax=Salvelinus alpinus TaxID=8036 RepID=UPI0039FC020D